jgi:predicted dehydrogenase
MSRVADLAWCCDLSAESRERYAPQYPQTRFTADFDDLLDDPAVDAIAVASSVPTHHPLGLRAIAAGKHVFIEKPLAASVADARELVEAAEKADRRLMVGHLLLFHPALAVVHGLIDSGALGDVYYLYGNRVNLGQVRADENALWSLGAHDVAVLLDLVGERPVEAQARGECYVRPGIEDVVFGYLKFPSGVIAHLHLSWLDPHKMRKLTVVGSQKMVVFDDMETDRKVTIYDKSASRSPSTDSYGEYVSVRFGDISIPRIPNDEPLRLECQEFVDAIGEGREPRCNGREGLAVVEVLESMQTSLDEGGRVVTVPS